jgi:hypothetical protein
MRYLKLYEQFETNENFSADCNENTPNDEKDEFLEELYKYFIENYDNIEVLNFKWKDNINVKANINGYYFNFCLSDDVEDDIFEFSSEYESYGITNKFSNYQKDVLEMIARVVNIKNENIHDKISDIFIVSCINCLYIDNGQRELEEYLVKNIDDINVVPYIKNGFYIFDGFGVIFKYDKISSQIPIKYFAKFVDYKFDKELIRKYLDVRLDKHPEEIGKVPKKYRELVPTHLDAGYGFFDSEIN